MSNRIRNHHSVANEEKKIILSNVYHKCGKQKLKLFNFSLDVRKKDSTTYLIAARYQTGVAYFTLDGFDLINTTRLVLELLTVTDRRLGGHTLVF